MMKGVPISPGVAVARAYCLDHGFARREPNHLDDAALSDEVNRFNSAWQAAVDELDATISRVSQQVGEEEAAIFKAHRALLRDPNFITKVKSTILSKHVDAATALHDVVEGYTALLEKIEDPYLRERMV